MHATPTAIPSLPPALVWTGRVLSSIVVLFLVFDGVMKLMAIPPVVDAFRQLGYPLESASVIGYLALACALLYAIPRTAVLGAIVLTGLLGGAISTHVRVHDPLFTHTLFGVYLGVMAWGGLWLRDARLRAIIPLRRDLFRT
ncbi:DoxX family protein [Ramlibacter sp.]|uniref:DoxX family protein n=1 Tax=Ramlibacter sp. TaxID=1917967 RepID=UPI00260762E4|nr:DoxX family protein [Ramlibacter sp.]MDB5958210.1 hypothetical protein [Ramlibacter sp.]